MRHKVMKKQNDAWVVLQKEMDLENMVRKEEKEKEGVDLEKEQIILKREKRKKRCMQKALKKRERQKQENSP